MSTARRPQTPLSQRQTGGPGRAILALAGLLGLAAAATGGSPPGDECPDCIPVIEGTYSGSTFDNTGTTGDDSPCGFMDTIDEWYCYTASCTGTATASTCNAANFDTIIAIFDGCPEDGGSPVACNDDELPVCVNNSSIITWKAKAGFTYYVRISGFFDLQGEYDLTLSCEPDGPCPGSGNCFLPNDTPGCVDAACCQIVCSVDLFCCDVQWDGACVTTALSECNNGACGGEGHCYEQNAEPGCDNFICCNIVCLEDPFCCDVAWDGGCVTIAGELCTLPPACGLPGTGSCFEAHGTPYCDDEACCDEVCFGDPGCCQMDWDEACAAAAETLCRPENNACADAILIGDDPVAFDTHLATTDGAALDGFCDPGPLGDDQIYNDVWYRYVPLCNGEMTVTTCSSADFDTRLAVYDSTDCPEDPATILGCNDNTLGCIGLTAEVTVPVTAGEVYLVRLGSTNQAVTGAGEIKVLASPAFPPTLTLDVYPGAEGMQVGGQVEVHLVMSQVCPTEVKEFRAYLHFDPDELAFVSGTYPDEPFGNPIEFPIVATGSGDIDLASSISQSQDGTTADATLAILSFDVLQTPEGCVPDLGFRDHVPPSAIIDMDGEPVAPMVLAAPLPRIDGDVTFDGVVDLADLLEIIVQFGDCPAPPSFCDADLDCDGEVDVLDLVEVILNWG